MKFELLDQFSLPGDGAKPNEDAFGFGTTAAVVLDGATPLGPGLMPGSSDAAWIAGFGARRLIAHLDQGEDGMTALGAALAETQKSFQALRRHAPSQRWQLPCASMMPVTAAHSPCAAAMPQTDAADRAIKLSPPSHRTCNEIEFFWYGDCAALVKQGDSKCAIIGETFEKRAAEAESARKLARDKNVSPASGLDRPDFIAALRQARNSVNRRNWLFSPSVRALSHVCRRSLTLSRSTLVLLASDGFLALASDYRAYDPSALMAAACEKGLARLGQELREIEGQDRGGDRFPRFKKSDDATAVLLRVA